MIIETERLVLRGWEDRDREDWIRLNKDRDVMNFFPNTLTEEESISSMERYCKHLDEFGYSFFVVEEKENGGFVGVMGFLNLKDTYDFYPGVEIGWRFNKKFWDKGLASEAGRACLAYGFNDLGFDQIYSFTADINKPSERLMIRLGMTHVGYFDHPGVVSSRLKKHRLYKIEKPKF